MTSELGADYIIVDTSPGIRFWSINSLAIADILLLTLKMSDLDIDGTRIVAEEIYRFFIEAREQGVSCIQHGSGLLRS